MAIKVERSALVTFSAQQMFDLVNNIEAYPQYMDGCTAAEVLCRDDNCVEARLTLSKVGMHYSFVTHNRLRPPEEMTMSLVEGPFRQLEGGWQFKPLTDETCKVTLVLEFEFSHKLVALAANQWFESVANQLVDALCRRAEIVYGH